jgi:hypothetical protein
MDSQLEQKIRERAYELWVRDGHIPGKADDYWYQAEQEIRSEEGVASDDRSGSQTGSGLPDTSAMPDDVAMPSVNAVGLSENVLADVGVVKTRKKRAAASPKPDDAGLAPTTTPRRKRSVQTP